jgi:hypothetical protein
MKNTSNNVSSVWYYLHSTSTLAEPIISYENLLLNKSNILKENEGKGGIYM